LDNTKQHIIYTTELIENNQNDIEELEQKIKDMKKELKDK